MEDFVNRWAKNEWATGGKWANAAEYVAGKLINRLAQRIGRGSPMRYYIEVDELYVTVMLRYTIVQMD